MKGTTTKDAAAVLHPISISQVIVNFAARKGVDVATCLKGTDIQFDQLQDHEVLITRAQEMRLIENLIEALPTAEGIGFELGLQYNISTFGIWGFSLRNSRTLREATYRALRFLPLSTAYCSIKVFEDANGFGVYIDPAGIPAHLQRFLLERDMATGVNIVQELGLAGIKIHALTFTANLTTRHKENKLALVSSLAAEKIASLCGITPHYGCTHNKIVIQVADADRPLPMYNANLARILEDQCRAQLNRRQVSGLAGQVREQLFGALGLSASIEEVAQLLAISSRSLRRKLAHEDTTFRSIVDGERKQLAIQLLEQTQITLVELSLQLGYADTASFTRAFRRWYAVSPGEYRSMQLKDKSQKLQQNPSSE